MPGFWRTGVSFVGTLTIGFFGSHLFGDAHWTQAGLLLAPILGGITWMLDSERRLRYRDRKLDFYHEDSEP